MNKPVIEREMEIENQTIALLNKSEIDQQIATAHKYPRSIKKFLDNAIEMVTLSETIAQECIYSIPRDGKTIEGPSARFAEVIFSAWGNSRAGARIVNDDGQFLSAQGVFHDLERNTAVTFEVQRRVVDKVGRRFSPDMVGVTANAACSIALRNAILKGVPKAFWSDLYLAARKTVMGDFKTLPNRRASAFEQFQAFGISKEMVCKILSLRGTEDIGLEHLVTLGGMLTALKEGDTTPEELMKPKSDAPPAPNAPSAPADNAPPPVRNAKQEAPTTEEKVAAETKSETAQADAGEIPEKLKRTKTEAKPATTEAEVAPDQSTELTKLLESLAANQGSEDALMNWATETTMQRNKLNPFEGARMKQAIAKAWSRFMDEDK